jgi:hypothetical protein
LLLPPEGGIAMTVEKRMKVKRQDELSPLWKKCRDRTLFCPYDINYTVHTYAKVAQRCVLPGKTTKSVQKFKSLEV